MPDINEFLKKKSSKGGTKKSDWDISSIVSGPKLEPSRPQRRPGRGENSPILPEQPKETVEPVLTLASKEAETPKSTLSQTEQKLDSGLLTRDQKVT